MAKEYVINESINGDDLRRLRQLLGMTQKEFAVFTNASKRTVENWESKDEPIKGPIVTLVEILRRHPEIAEKLYGENLHFSFDYNEVKTIVEEGGTYPEEIRRRVIDVVMEMKRRYSYLFICE